MSSRDSLRILLSCEWFVRYTAGLGGGMQNLGHDVTLVTRDHELEFNEREGDFDRIVEGLFPGGRHLRLGGRTRELGRMREVARMCRAVKAWAPDVVHVQDSLANDIRLGMVSGLRRGNYALTVHDPVRHPGEGDASPRVERVRRLIRRNAGLVFVHSDALATELEGTGEVRAPIEVVPHGVEEGSFVPLPEDDTILFFGRIFHYKGVDILLDAMSIVWEQRPRARLVIAGLGELEAHPALDDSRVEIRNRYITEEEVPELFCGAVCVALPYRQASQSGVGSQARQYGRAVVATAVGGLPELVTSDRGRVVPPEDPGALAASLLELLADRELAAAMGHTAATGLGDASWTEVARATVAAYRRHLL